MATTWSIENTVWYTAPVEQGDPPVEYDQVIFSLSWQATDTETDGDVTYFGRDDGSQGLDISDLADGFVSFSDVTEEQAIEWLEAALGTEGVEQIEKNIADDIARKKNPPVEAGTPWTEVA